MAVQNINIGSGPNTGDGTPIRDAFVLVNDVIDLANQIELSQNSGLIAYATLAGLNADLSKPDSSLAEVTNDLTTSNNQSYRKTGAAGTGSWVATVDRLASFSNDLASTATGKGAALVGLLQSGTGAAARTVQDELRDRVSVKQFGAKGDGVTDDGAAIQLAFNAAAGRAVYFPDGNYLSSIQITSSAVDVVVRGSGVKSSRIIFTATTGGFAFALNAQGTGIPPNQLFFSSLTIESRAAVSSPALSATWSTYQPNAQGQAWIKDVNIVRKADGTGSFTNGIQLNKCITGFIDHCVLLGDDLRVSSIGLNFIDCVGIRVSNTDVNRHQTGVSATVVSATQTEGIYLSNCFLYDVNKGVSVTTAIHVELLGTHININGASAAYSCNLTSVSQAFISNCLIYAGGASGDAANQDGVQLITCSGVTISNNVFSGSTKVNTRYAITCSGLATYNQIIGNNVSAFTNGVSFGASGDTNNNLIGNQLYTCTTNVGDAGAANYRAHNTADGIPLDGLTWGTSTGTFAVGQISTNASWGAYIKGRSGTSGDIVLADSSGANTVNIQAPGLLAFHAATPVAQSTGWGTPTGAAKLANFPGATATLAQTSAQLAQIIADLESKGLLGA